MLSISNIEETFALYSGEDMTEEGPRKELCALLCRECRDRAEAAAQARTGGELGETELCALESWAAAEALHQLCLADEAAAPASITADGVQIAMGERSKKAEALAAEKKAALKSFLGEEGFYFGVA